MRVVLVEGPSDAAAVGTLARLRGVDLAAAGAEVTSMGGITNLARWSAPDRLLLHDAGETAFVRRTIERTGHPLRTFVCDADLEDELVRALGVPAALEVVERAGDLEAWTTLTHQPFHRGRPADAVLRRFLGTIGGRKVRYAALLIEAAAERDVVPAPLTGLLDEATDG